MKLGVIPAGSVVLVTMKPRGRVDEPVKTVAVMDDEALVEPCVTVRLLGEGVEKLNV